MTKEEIIENASKRKNPATHGNGLLYRKDMFDFLATLPPDADKRAEFEQFLNECPFITATERTKIMTDLPSYGL